MKLSSILESIRSKTRHAGEKPTCKSDKTRLNDRVCPYCNGSGIDNSHPANTLTMQPQRCSVCGGRGRIPL
ncbi:MAG: hypothetical protein Q4D22_00815 [Candidatus Saccharibacteria bacterium]|nr:hypothetical protein [Candidatus Saccharibacteria bacterium]